MHMEGTIEYVETEPRRGVPRHLDRRRRRPRAPAARGVRPRGADLGRLVRRLLPAARLTFGVEFGHERPTLLVRHFGQSARPGPVAGRLRRRPRRRRDHGRRSCSWRCFGLGVLGLLGVPAARLVAAAQARRGRGRLRRRARGRAEGRCASIEGEYAVLERTAIRAPLSRAIATSKASTTSSRPLRMSHGAARVVRRSAWLRRRCRAPTDRRRRRRLRLIPIIGYTVVALGLAYFLAERMPTTVIFVRHADTDAAMAGPDDDPPLNARGRQRAELLADLLAERRRRRRARRHLRERQAPHAGDGRAAREAVEHSRSNRRPPRHRGLHGPRAARARRRHRADRFAFEHDRAADRRAARQQEPAARSRPTSTTRSTSSRSRGRSAR